MVASVRHFGYSRSSGLAPGRVYLMTSPFSDSTDFSVHTRKQRFQKASLSNRTTLESVFEWLRYRFRRCSVDDSRIRSKTAPFSFENGLVWTGPPKYTTMRCVVSPGPITGEKTQDLIM